VSGARGQVHQNRARVVAALFSHKPSRFGIDPIALPKPRPNGKIFPSFPPVSGAGDSSSGRGYRITRSVSMAAHVPAVGTPCALIEPTSLTRGMHGPSESPRPRFGGPGALAHWATRRDTFCHRVPRSGNPLGTFVMPVFLPTWRKRNTINTLMQKRATWHVLCSILPDAETRMGNAFGNTLKRERRHWLHRRRPPVVRAQYRSKPEPQVPIVLRSQGGEDVPRRPDCLCNGLGVASPGSHGSPFQGESSSHQGLPLERGATGTG
jgi:hypothetical protein